jgi:hypothetical protein
MQSRTAKDKCYRAESKGYFPMSRPCLVTSVELSALTSRKGES